MLEKCNEKDGMTCLPFLSVEIKRTGRLGRVLSSLE